MSNKKSSKKKGSKKNNKFAHVRNVNPSKIKQTKFESDGVSQEINKLGVISQLTGNILDVLIVLACLGTGVYLVINNYSDPGFEFEWGNAKIHLTLVGIFIVIGGLYYGYKRNHDISVKNQKD